MVGKTGRISEDGGISDCCYDNESTLEAARNYIAACPPNFGKALHLLQKILSDDPNHYKALLICGEVLCELGDTEKAIEFFQRSISIQPEGDPMKYFYLGQLFSGYDARDCFIKAINCLQNEQSLLPEDEVLRLKEIFKHLCSCCCSLSELYMTDLCDEKGAEEECLKYLNLANDYDPMSIEAHHCMATYQKVLGNFEEAGKEAKLCVELIKRSEESNADEESRNVVSIELRTNLSRTLVDLMEIDTAIKILESCLAEDEEDVQVWYVLSCAYLAGGSFKQALKYAKRALMILESSELYEAPDCVIKEDVSSLIASIKQSINTQTDV